LGNAAYLTPPPNPSQKQLSLQHTKSVLFLLKTFGRYRLAPASHAII